MRPKHPLIGNGVYRCIIRESISKGGNKRFTRGVGAAGYTIDIWKKLIAEVQSPLHAFGRIVSI